MKKKRLNTKDALILSKVSGLSAEESVKALTEAINTFNDKGLDSNKFLKKYE